jgi:hypothetical protein
MGWISIMKETKKLKDKRARNRRAQLKHRYWKDIINLSDSEKKKLAERLELPPETGTDDLIEAWLDLKILTLDGLKMVRKAGKKIKNPPISK